MCCSLLFVVVGCVLYVVSCSSLAFVVACCLFVVFWGFVGRCSLFVVVWLLVVVYCASLLVFGSCLCCVVVRCVLRCVFVCCCVVLLIVDRCALFGVVCLLLCVVVCLCFGYMLFCVVVRCHSWFKVTRVVYGCLLLIVVDVNCVVVSWLLFIVCFSFVGRCLLFVVGFCCSSLVVVSCCCALWFVAW